VAPALRPRATRGTLPREPEVYGRTVQARPLEVWMPARASPTLLVLAGIHGEEPESTVVLSSALRSVDPVRLRAAVVLAANPDGLARGTRGNARGVELNRNFPSSDWSSEVAAHHFTRAEPQDVVLSPGPHPASEPETEALMALVGELSPAAVLAIHAPLGCVLDPQESGLARELAAAAGLPLQREIPTPTPGTLDTWVRESAGVPAVTFELPVISKNEAMTRFLPVLIDLLIAGAPPR
jgi:murein peptide amidase A